MKVDVQRMPDSERLPMKPLTPEEAAKVVIDMGDVRITAGEFMAYIETLPPQYREYARTVNKAKFAEEVVKIKFLAERARREKLDQETTIQSQIRFQTDNLLAGKAYQKVLTSIPVEPATLQAYYDKHKQEYESVKARHILVRLPGSAVPLRSGQKELTSDEALAKAQGLRKRLVAGEDFAKLAKEESDDVNSGANGGEVGSFKRGQMVPQFEEVAFAIKPGEISEPVRTPYGFHLIIVDEHESKSLEEMKPELEKLVRQESGQKALLDHIGKAGVKVDQSFFGVMTIGEPMVAPKPLDLPAAPPPAQ